MDEYEEAVLFTFGLLESRLDRLEYILGDEKAQEDKPRTFSERVQRIERSLKELSNKTELLKEVQQLISKHSEILEATAEHDDDDAGLDTAQKSALVVERAPSFATTASQLKALEDQQIPKTDAFTQLAKLRPRMAEAEDRQLQQALQISRLRRQSGLLVSRVRLIHLLGQGRCWVEWQQRLTKSEQTMMRTEFKHKKQAEED